MFDITFLDGQDFELVVKELAVVDSHSNMVSSYVVKRPYSWHKVPEFKPGKYQAIDHGLIGILAMYIFRTGNCATSKASSAVAVYCLGPQKTQFIGGIMDRTVIYVTQLGCPPLVDISLQSISCTFACHKFRHVVLCGQPIH